MTTIDWPATRACIPQSMSFRLHKAVLQSRSPYSGALMTADLVAERLMVSMTLKPLTRDETPAREALLTRAAGGMVWIRMGHCLRPVPRGSMRGSPTVSGAHTRGSTTLTIQTTAGATLLAGDLVSAGQLFVAAEDAVADGSGVLVLPLLNRVRGSIADGTAVVWSRPTATWILPAPEIPIVHRPRYSEPLAIDLEEVW